MSIRSDICVLTLFELFKVSIHISIKKKPISIYFLHRKKKMASGTARRENRCHTCVRTHGTATNPVADARYSVDTVPHVSTDVVRHRAHSGIPSQSQVSSNTRIFLPCRCGAAVCDGAHG